MMLARILRTSHTVDMIGSGHDGPTKGRKGRIEKVVPKAGSSDDDKDGQHSVLPCLSAIATVPASAARDFFKLYHG